MRDLVQILVDKSPTSAEHDVSLAEWSRLRIAEFQPNRELVFKFDWRRALWEEDGAAPKRMVLEWFWRLMKHSFRGRGKHLGPAEVMQFFAVPEIWSRHGDQVDLHYHALVRATGTGLPWIDSPRAKKAWSQILAQYGITGSIHIAPINDIHCLSRYQTKQCDIDWIFQNTIEPIDLQRAVMGTT